jgi:hypothetical protein
MSHFARIVSPGPGCEVSVTALLLIVFLRVVGSGTLFAWHG